MMIVVILSIFSSSLTSKAEGATSFGTNYRQLLTIAGATNSNTSVSIGSTGNFVVDPYTSGSTLEGTPSETTPSAYGWRTVGAEGTIVPAGTWTFQVTTHATALATLAGDAHVRIYVYSTNLLGSDILLIGYDDAPENIFPLSIITSTTTSNLSFSAPETDLTGRVLVFEYWLIVDSLPLLETPTLTFDTVSAATTAQLPSPLSTIYYLGTPRLHSVGLDESIGTAISSARLYHALRTPNETFTIQDSIDFHVTRSIPESLQVAEDIMTKATRFESDSFVISDAIETNVRLPASESLHLSDLPAITLLASRSTSNDLAVTDSIMINVRRPISENIVIDSAISPFYHASSSAGEMLTVSDVVSVRLSRSLEQNLSLADTISIGITRSHEDDILVTDSVVFRLTRSISDSIVIGEEPSVNILRSSGENINLVDNVNVRISRTVLDSVTLIDAVSRGAARAVTDTIGVSASPLVHRNDIVAIGESLNIGAQIANVSVHWNRFFEESMVLGECSPFACNGVLHLSEGLVFGTVFSVPPTTSDAVAISDKSATLVRPAPPPAASGSQAPHLGVLLASDKTLVDLQPSVAIPGQYSIQGGNLDPLVTQLNLSTIQISNTISDSNLANTVLVLPVYHVTLLPSAQINGDDALVTARVSQIPASTTVVVPIDISGTPQTAEHANFPWMSVEYAPAVDSSNFALAISIVDAPPQGAQPPIDPAPLYLDVRWVGSFAGGLSPSDAGFFTAPPAFTFALSESWAAQENVQRDSNGVPLISLNLLDDSIGTWQPINAIDRPSAAINGEYVYIAHLQHFSTYVVTAPVSTTFGGGSRGTTAPPVFVVRLADSLHVNEALTNPDPMETRRGDSKHKVDLVDSLIISDRTIEYSTLRLGDNIIILVRLADVSHGTIFPPTAKAAIEFSLFNNADTFQEFMLNLRYGNIEEEGIFEASRLVALSPGEKRTDLVEIPFGSPGTFNLLAEASSIDEEPQSATHITVNVPWIAVYFYLLLTIATTVLIISVPVTLYLIRKTFTSVKL